ncbi:hypothetical protein B0H19DRAFT_1275132 [Mycena capillaripes]|nr:hypothetical protein B0H19DRAFT_1275132 [Mycena capillaripes]
MPQQLQHSHPPPDIFAKSAPCLETFFRDFSAMYLTIASWNCSLALLLEMVYIVANGTEIRFLTALRVNEGVVPAILVFNALRELLCVRHVRATPLEMLKIGERNTRLEIEDENWDTFGRLFRTFIQNP